VPQLGLPSAVTVRFGYHWFRDRPDLPRADIHKRHNKLVPIEFPQAVVVKVKAASLGFTDEI
jgi:hypothetical protein